MFKFIVLKYIFKFEGAKGEVFEYGEDLARQLAGHSDVRTTKRYARLNSRELAMVSFLWKHNKGKVDVDLLQRAIS